MTPSRVQPGRRAALKTLAAASAALAAPAVANAAELLPKAGPRVVIVGGGFGGLIAAKTLRRAMPTLDVVLVERDKTYTACPGSNLVIGGSRAIDANRIGYETLTSAHGVRVVHDSATAIDAAARTLTLNTGSLAYDRLIVAPGIDFRVDALAGYDPARTPRAMPHAWQGGEQTLLLREQLRQMPDGGTVIVAVPLPAFRCPPGPYERVSQIAWYLKQHKPKSKILVLDANPDILTKGALFRKGWAKHYPGMIDYRGGHGVVRVSTDAMTVHTEVEDLRGDVINLIPPQHAGAIAHAAGLVGDDGKWCPIDPVTFESTRKPGVHVIGDACDAGAMPKSGFSANAQAKICALNIAALLQGQKPVKPSAANVCYSFITDREAISVAAVYRAEDGKLVAIPGAGGLSPDLSEAEALYGRAWLTNILAEMST